MNYAFALLLAALPLLTRAQQLNNAPLAPNAPADRPFTVKATESEAAAKLAGFERYIAPAVQRARATLPQAKRRFQQGLPAGQAFFVTTRLTDPSGLSEQVFVRVRRWDGRQVQGQLASQLNGVKSFRPEQVLTFPESAVLDWTISHPDGTEEGNFVGKLLDQGTN